MEKVGFECFLERCEGVGIMSRGREFQRFEAAVEVLDHRCDVFSGWGVGEQPGSGILHILQFSEGSGRETVENAIAVVLSGGDEGMDKCFCG